MRPLAPVARRLCLGTASVVALLGVAACSGSSGTSASGSQSATSAAPSASATSSPGDSSSKPTHKAAPTQSPAPVESNPPGDIPDNLAFVRYANGPGHYSFTHPEGWARTSHGKQVRFTDKLNGVTVDSLAASQATTVTRARKSDVPRLRSSVAAFRLRSISAAHLPAGNGVHIVFRRNSAADPVTGKVYRDEVEEYDVYSHGRLVRMDLYGPVGADNVDAYRTMSTSLHIS